ncbi:MAG: hypothetical protein ACRDSF_00595 [Pseudonocardiaceae bacterium]
MSNQDPDLITIDSDYYTIDEIDQIEQLTGAAFTTFMQGEGPKAKELRILALLMRRRTDPDFPEEKVGALKVSFKKAPVPPTSDSDSEPSQPLSSTTG